MKEQFEPLRIGNLVASLPIIQGGMGVGVSLSGLAAAVANQGGIGIISAVGIGMLDPEHRSNLRKANQLALRKEIRRARELSNGIIGVNIMMAVTDFDDLLRLSVEEGVDVAIIGAGLFLKRPDFLTDSVKTKIIPKVSSARAARLIFAHWVKSYGVVPDAVVVEGPMAGGHLGFKKESLGKAEVSLERLVRETVEAIAPFEKQFSKHIPVIAAGGVYTGSDMHRMLCAGAKGVKMGTRFVTTTECDVSDAFKQSYIRCHKEDVTIIESPVGLPGRVIANDFVREIKEGKRRPVKCAWKCLKTCDYKKVPFCIAEALYNAAIGDLENGFAFAGSNAYQAKEIISVRETVERIAREFARAQLRKPRPVFV